MSDDEEVPSREPVQLVALQEQTAEGIERYGTRYCDACGVAQLFGCVYALHVGWSYHELCQECFGKLKSALV